MRLLEKLRYSFESLTPGQRHTALLSLLLAGALLVFGLPEDDDGRTLARQTENTSGGEVERQQPESQQAPSPATEPSPVRSELAELPDPIETSPPSAPEEEEEEKEEESEPDGPSDDEPSEPSSPPPPPPPPDDDSSDDEDSEDELPIPLPPTPLPLGG